MMKVYMKIILYNINLDEVDKILKDYVSTHNKKFNILFFIVNLKYNLIIFIPEIYQLHVFTIKILRKYIKV